jgi:hypothetical protein
MGRFVDDVAIMETVCDLVAQDVNAVLFMNNEPVPERGWRANTTQAFMHSSLLRFTLTAYARKARRKAKSCACGISFNDGTAILEVVKYDLDAAVAPCM